VIDVPDVLDRPDVPDVSDVPDAEADVPCYPIATWERYCANVRDDDCDGLLDCADPDCQYAPECCVATGSEICTNGLDDDCDTHVDCDDSDCWDHPWCCVATGPEVCNDRVDNDCDGTTDCSDFDCRRSPICIGCRPEVCTDLIDNDCDTTTDCADGDCYFNPACCVPSPEVCSDGLDNDCDGQTDCTDTWDCAADPSCCWMNPEICDDGVDNNCDGLSDCLDWACASDPACGPDTCASAVDVSASGSWYGNTCAMNDDYQGTCRPTNSPDVVFVGSVARRIRVQVDTIGSSFDTVLYVRSGDCLSGAELGCDDDSGGSLTSLLNLTLAAGTYYVFVDGYGSGSCGDYVLNITPR
jgi:hypothetical protein